MGFVNQVKEVSGKNKSLSSMLFAHHGDLFFSSTYNSYEYYRTEYLEAK